MIKELAVVVLVIGAATAGTLDNYMDRVSLSDEGEDKTNYLVKQYECTQQDFHIETADSDEISVENTGEKDIEELELTWEYQEGNNTKNTLRDVKSGETMSSSTLGTGELATAYAEIPGCLLKTESFRP